MKEITTSEQKEKGKARKGFFERILSPIKSLFKTTENKNFNPLLFFSTASANLEEEANGISSLDLFESADSLVEIRQRSLTDSDHAHILKGIIITYRKMVQ